MQCKCGGACHRTTGNESELVCDSCGMVTQLALFTSDFTSYDTETGYVKYDYRRVEHFVKRLALAQGATPPTKFLPTKSELHGLSQVLYNKGARKVSDISVDMVRAAMKQQKLRHLYDFTSHVHFCVTGVVPPRLTDLQERTLVAEFKKIQDPFTKLKPPGRRNFLSYTFVIRKLCERHGHTALIQYLPVLKGSRKRQTANQIWDAIRRELGWAQRADDT